MHVTSYKLGVNNQEFGLICIPRYGACIICKINNKRIWNHYSCFEIKCGVNIIFLNNACMSKSLTWNTYSSENLIRLRMITTVAIKFKKKYHLLLRNSSFRAFDHANINTWVISNNTRLMVLPKININVAEI